MSTIVRRMLRHTPLLWRYADRFRERFPGSASYWERRYRQGGNSGEGSYDHLAAFKAEILNAFVERNGIQSVIEWGCGDGNQLRLAHYPSYVGLDVSPVAVRRCISIFESDQRKSFLLYDSTAFLDPLHVLSADLALSLDVVYHLVEDDVFARYMSDLFASAKRYVIVYSSDHDEVLPNTHVRHRRFSSYVEESLPPWHRVETITNRYPPGTTGMAGSFADFHVFARDSGEWSMSSAKGGVSAPSADA